MGDGKVQVVGLSAFRRALKQAGASFPKQLRAANKAAAQIIVPEARSRGGQTFQDLAGNPTQLGSRGVASIGSLASQTRAQVRMRGPNVMGMEWGSGGRYKQFPSRDRKGHILFPAVMAKQQEIRDAYYAALEALTREAFPE